MSAGPDLLGVKRAALMLGAVLLVAGCGDAGQYDEQVCNLLSFESRKWVEFDLRQQHGLDQYEAVAAVDHAISEYCPDVELR